MKKILAGLLALAGLTNPATSAEPSIRVGDSWSYAVRPGEEGSFLVIRKIEIHPKLGEIVHISVYGLKIKNTSAPTGFTTEAGHLPISGASLRESIKEKITATIPKTDWEEGYKAWHEAKGGVFSKPVSECVGFIDDAINRGKKS